MSELISGEEALIALANGDLVEMCDSEVGMDWTEISPLGYISEMSSPCLPMFLEKSDHIQFRLKPKTITLNGIEVPAPFEPKEGEKYYHLYPERDCGYGFNEFESNSVDSSYMQFGAWRSEDEIKQVVAALRKIFVINNQ